MASEPSETVTMLARVLCNEWDKTPADPCQDPRPCPAHFREADAIVASDWLTDRERAAAEKALRDAADEMDRFRLETYSADIFRRPTSEDYAAINALLRKHRGHQTDGIAADCMDRAIRVQAQMLRQRAEELRDNAGSDGAGSER